MHGIMCVCLVCLGLGLMHGCIVGLIWYDCRLGLDLVVGVCQSGRLGWEAYIFYQEYLHGILWSVLFIFDNVISV